MADITSTITWNTSDNLWEISASHNAFDEANWGIPVNTYIYKIYIDIDFLSEIRSTLHSERLAPNARKETLKDHILTNSKFVRPSDNEDFNVVTIDALVEDVHSKYTTDVYEDWTDYTQLEVTSESNPAKTSSTATVSGTKAGEGLWVNIYGNVMRQHSSEHLPLSGYYYFRTKDLGASKVNYDSAKSLLDSSLHYLEWRTKGNSSNNKYFPLSVGVASVTPSREFSPNSAIVNNLIAGDVIRINISGGSGEYTVVPSDSSKLSKLGTSLNYWRVITNETTSLVLTITDVSIPNLSETITLNVIIKES